jgi:hypothetical protein
MVHIEKLGVPDKYVHNGVTINDDTPLVPTQQGQVAWFYMTHLGGMPTPHSALTYLLEEMNELIVALEQGATDEEILKEIQDVRFTLAGYEVARGWNGHAAFQAVVASNQGKPASVDGQKVPKGDGYVAPDMRQFLGGSA